jgi:PST family polysaccharide transporter
MTTPDPPAPADAEAPSLRTRVLRGGSFMVARQALGMVISLVGVILVTRLIGPAEYGRFAACIGIYSYCFILASWGIDIYLMRRPEGQADRTLLDQAFTLLLLFSILAGGVGLALAKPIEALVNVEGFAPMVSVFFLGLPVALVVLPARVKLERDLDYHRIAVIELFAVFQFQATALALAWYGFGAWSLILSWVVNQSLTLLLICLAARYLPRWSWSRASFREMIKFGSGYTASSGIIQMRVLINPLIVTPLAGVTAAGYVGMASMFVFRLSVVKYLSEKMSVAALAKVQDQRDKVRALVGEGMQLHVLCVGLPLTAFSLVGPWLIPRLMGEQWGPVAQLVPLVAIGFLVNAVFGLHSCVLQIYERNWDVAAFNVVLMVLLFGGSAVLVPRLDAGYLGYGWAEVMTIPAYLVIHILLRRQVGAPDSRVALVWTAGLSLLMLHPWLGWGAVAGAGLVLLWPMTWTTLGDHVRQLRQAALVRA